MGTVGDVPENAPPTHPIPPRVTADPAVLAQLAATARAEAGPFVDPRLLPATRAVQRATPTDWQSAVLGRDVAALTARPLSWAEAVLLLRAADVDAEHLQAREQATRADAAARTAADAAQLRAAAAAEQAEWAALRDALPVEVRVRHNWTLIHTPGYVVGRDHLVLTAPLHVGRLRRDAWTALCQTPAREHDLRGLDTDPNSTYAEDRVPSCQACLRIAHRLAGHR